MTLKTIKWLCDGKRQNGQFGNQWIMVKDGEITEGFPSDQLRRLKEGVHYEIVPGLRPLEAIIPIDIEKVDPPGEDVEIEKSGDLTEDGVSPEADKAVDEALAKPKPKRKGKRKIVKSKE